MCCNGYEIEVNLFRHESFKVGRCSCKNIGSSHLKVSGYPKIGQSDDFCFFIFYYGEDKDL